MYQNAPPSECEKRKRKRKENWVTEGGRGV
jgi:hypothetical protein